MGLINVAHLTGCDYSCRKPELLSSFFKDDVLNNVIYFFVALKANLTDLSPGCDAIPVADSKPEE